MASHEAAKPPGFGWFDALSNSSSDTKPSADVSTPSPSEFATPPGVQVSTAAVPTKDELLAKLKARADVDAAEFDRWARIVQSTPDADWPIVALQLQAVLNYKTFQASQIATARAPSPGSAAPGPPPEAKQPATEPVPTNGAVPAAATTPTAASASEPAAPAETTSPVAPAANAEATPSTPTPPPAKDPQPAAAPSAIESGSPQPAPPSAEAAHGEAPPSASADPWRTHVERAIEALEKELEGTPAERTNQLATATPAVSEEEFRSQAERQRQRAHKEAHLRLLYLAAQRNTDAARGIESFPPAEQEFWKHQVHGMGVFLDEQGAPVPDRRARLALRELQEGLHHLAAASGLDVRNLAFCPQVFGFGNYVEFSPYEFRPNQEVLLYAEIDNFAAESRPDGYETELQGSYQIFDITGRRVADHVFPPEKEVCRNRRRDYFVPFRMYMPKRIAPGPYTLQLTVEDLKGRKFGQASIRFAIVP
jgi:hypothetical protein